MPRATSTSNVRYGAPVNIRLPIKINSILKEVAQETNTTVSYLARRAFEVFIDEGYLDAEIATLRMENDSAQYSSLTDVSKRLGLKVPEKEGKKGGVKELSSDITDAVVEIVQSYYGDAR